MPARAERGTANFNMSAGLTFYLGLTLFLGLKIKTVRFRVCGAGSCSHSSSVPSAMSVSHSEYLRVPRLDLVSALFDTRRIVLERFDFLERFAAGLLLDQRMHGMGARKVDQQLLGFTGVQPVLEQARRVGIRRRLEQRARARDQGSTFGGIYDFYRLPLLLELDEIVVVAIGHHGALAESDLLRSIGRGLNLHHSLL